MEQKVETSPSPTATPVRAPEIGDRVLFKASHDEQSGKDEIHAAMIALVLEPTKVNLSVMSPTGYWYPVSEVFYGTGIGQWLEREIA